MNRGLAPLGGDKSSLLGLDTFRGSSTTTPGPGAVPVSDGAGRLAMASPRWNPRLSCYNLRPDNMPNWRRAATQIRLGTARPNIVCLGDSTTIGSASSGVFPQAYPARLGPLLTQRGLTFSESPWGGPTGVYGGTDDTRVAFGTGWSNGAGSASTTGDMVVTPVQAFDTVIIRWNRNNGLGQVPVHIDGVLNTTIDCNVPNNGIMGITTITGLANTTHTVAFKPPTGIVEIFEVAVHTSAVPGGRVYNGGRSAETVGGYVQRTQFPQSSFNYTTALAPAVTTINFTINDANPRTNMSEYRRIMQNIINQARVAGDAFLIVGNPASGAQHDLLDWGPYRLACYQLADLNDIPLLDLTARWRSGAAASSLGFLFDTTHPSVAGQMDIAAGLANALLSVV